MNKVNQPLVAALKRVLAAAERGEAMIGRFYYHDCDQLMPSLRAESAREAAQLWLPRDTVDPDDYSYIQWGILVPVERAAESSYVQIDSRTGKCEQKTHITLTEAL